MANKTCLDITFNPHGYTVGELRALLRHDLLSTADLERIFGREEAEQILHCAAPIDLSEPLSSDGSDDSTLILVWGLPDSGKSTFMAATATLPGMKLDGQGDERLQQLVKVFRNTHTPQQLPDMSKGNGPDTYHLLYRKNWWSKRYPITLKEMPLPADGLLTDHIRIEDGKDLIHLFCIDCRQDLHQQAQQFDRLIAYLKTNNLLERTSGIYLLVTKTDLMKAPRQMQENAAQTLVTSGLPDLWHTVQNICYSKHIYNAMPLPFSTGRYVVKDLAVLSDEHAAQLFEEALLPKCQPRRTFIGRFLDQGKTWHAIVLIIALIAGVGYGAYRALDVLDAPPTSPLFPYDYKKSFLAAEAPISKSDYEDARQLYQRLKKDLDTEKVLKTADGQPVLSLADSRACQSALIGDFAKVVEKEARHFFSTDNWSRKGDQLNHLRSDLNELMALNVPDTSMLSTYSGYISTYFIDIKPLMTERFTCHSADDVIRVSNIAKKASQHPYNNDSTIIAQLSTAKLRAFDNCSRYLSHAVDSIITEHNKNVNILQKYNIIQNEKREELEDELAPYLNQVNRLLDMLEDINDDAYDEIIERLENIRRRIKNNTFTFL